MSVFTPYVNQFEAQVGFYRALWGGNEPAIKTNQLVTLGGIVLNNGLLIGRTTGATPTYVPFDNTAAFPTTGSATQILYGIVDDEFLNLGSNTQNVRFQIIVTTAGTSSAGAIASFNGIDYTFLTASLSLIINGSTFTIATAPTSNTGNLTLGNGVLAIGTYVAVATITSLGQYISIATVDNKSSLWDYSKLYGQNGGTADIDVLVTKGYALKDSIYTDGKVARPVITFNSLGRA